ncbi:MAG: thioredoxin family protein [Acidiferrobacteraceae bacterium]|nr:thioredoxin family protein [Acidiferrobacteraceae bacterium]
MAHISTMQDLGTTAPYFSLPNTNTKIGSDTVTLDDFVENPALLVAFYCNHCPYVIHIRDSFVKFASEYTSKGLAIVAICANDVETHPDDSPEHMEKQALQFGYPFAYLYDESQKIAKDYRAACTPDFFLYNKSRKLVYRGQFDGSRPGNNIAVTGADLRAAADALLHGAEVPLDQNPSMGCNIKWRPGMEPDYFGV